MIILCTHNNDTNTLRPGKLYQHPQCLWSFTFASITANLKTLVLLCIDNSHNEHLKAPYQETCKVALKSFEKWLNTEENQWFDWKMCWLLTLMGILGTENSPDKKVAFFYKFPQTKSLKVLKVRVTPLCQEQGHKLKRNGSAPTSVFFLPQPIELLCSIKV